MTRATDGYKFDYVLANSGIYAKSPFYVGANTWNKFPTNIQNMNSKEKFKREMRDRIF